MYSYVNLFIYLSINIIYIIYIISILFVVRKMSDFPVWSQQHLLPQAKAKLKVLFLFEKQGLYNLADATWILNML